MPKTKKKEYKLAWMNKRSLKEMLRIEKAGDDEWCRQDFLDFHSTQGNVIVVMEDSVSVVGFVALSVAPKQVEIVKLGLHNSAKRNDYRDKLINYVKRVSFKSKDKLYLKFVINEVDDELREYLISQRFCVIKVLPNYFDGRDGYACRCFNT